MVKRDLSIDEVNVCGLDVRFVGTGRVFMIAPPRVRKVLIFLILTGVIGFTKWERSVICLTGNVLALKKRSLA